MARQGMSPGIRREGVMARNGVIAGNGRRSPAGPHDYACGRLVQRVLGSLRVTGAALRGESRAATARAMQ